MKINSGIAIIGFTVATTSLYAEDFNRVLHTGPTPHVAVSTNSGYVHVSPNGGNDVQIVAHVRKGGGWNMGWGSGNVDDRIRQIISNPPIEQNGDNIVVGRMGNPELMRNIVIDYDVTVPRHASVEARSGSGDIRANGMENAFAGSTGSGDVEVTGTRGNIRLDSGSGSVRAREISGNAILKTGSGDIELGQSAPGDVLADTGSGSIRIRNIHGAFRAQTGSGDIEVQGGTTGDCKAQSGSGSIRLDLGRDAHFRVDAITGSGSIRIAQAGGQNGDNRQHRVSTTVNGGGPALKLVTGSGDIEIR